MVLFLPFAQHHQTGRVLMVAWMNREALQLTAEKNQAVYYSRSRQNLAQGRRIGTLQTVHEIRLDCDADVIILQIEQHGGIACHTGRESCFIVNSRQKVGKLLMLN